MSKKSKKDTRNNSWYFLGIVIILYIISAILRPEKTLESLEYVLKIVRRIIPIIILVIVFMGLSNYFLNPKRISSYVGAESGAKGYLIAILTGVISHGPIYVWYTLLENLKDKGMKNGLIAVFLYNRAIKIPLLPLLIFYFGLKYSIILLVVMMFTSILQGIFMELVLENPTKVEASEG